MDASPAIRSPRVVRLADDPSIEPRLQALWETEPGAWDRVQAVNTRGVFLCCKHGIPYLLERGGGSVINVASFVALLGAATSDRGTA